MPNTLFSTYTQGENRVTSTILAVFERLSFSLVEQILQALCQEPEASLLTFSNQPAGIHSTLDGRIRASFAYWIETKKVPNSVSGKQIRAHLRALDAETHVERQRLLVLTPDAAPPKELAQIGDPRIAWANFDQLIDVIEEIVTPGEGWLMSDRVFPGEQERNLLRELVQFLSSERLIGAAVEQVLLVPAKKAIKEYLHHGVYMCQPNRFFQPCARIAFYVEGRIDQRVPKILASIESVIMSEDGIQRAEEDLRPQLRRLWEGLSAERSDRLGEDTKVLFLTGHDDRDTYFLEQPIVNDQLSSSGKPTAFVQAQRYIMFSRLKSAKKTSELIGK